MIDRAAVGEVEALIRIEQPLEDRTNDGRSRPNTPAARNAAISLAE